MRMRLKPILLPAVISLGTLAIGTFALAAGNFGLDAAVAGTGIPQTGSLPILIGKILQTVLSFVGALFLLLTIYAGFIYMTARGDEKKVGDAKKMLIGAVTGMIIIGAAYALTTLVLNVATGPGGGTSTDTTSGTPQQFSVPLGGACTESFQCMNALLCNATTHTCQPSS